MTRKRTPAEKSPRDLAQAQGMTQIHLKLVFGVLATVVTLLFLFFAYSLASNQNEGAAALAALVGVVGGGGGLFWLFERMTR